MPKYRFTINRCPTEEGIGWEIRYFEGRFEFPDTRQIITAIADDEDAIQHAYDKALEEAESWVLQMGGWPPSWTEKPEADPIEQQLGFDFDSEDDEGNG